MDESMIGADVHYVNAADGQHYQAKILAIHHPGEQDTADLDVEVPVGDGKRYNVLNDEELKAGNTWHFIELE